MRIFQKGFIFCLLLLAIVVNTQSPAEDQVQTPIPGYPHKFYSGYLDINVINKKSIHYVYFESQNNIAKDPLVIWLSGGPGCSSLLGAFHENGPFRFKPGKHTFDINPNAWNVNANLLYLQLPAGVGFSQIENQSEIVDDGVFVEQATSAIRMFLSRFQKLKKNQLYLTGHGYAAVYVANLAKQMIDQNNGAFVVFNDKWNLKGVLMGNPCTRPDQCYASGSYRNSKYHYQFLYKRAFFSKTSFQKYQSWCSFNDNSYQCFQQRMKLDNLFNDTNTSQYNIYDKCYKGKNDSVDLGYVNTGCQDQAGLMTYLNDDHVQVNWNIRLKQWKPCNQKIFEAYTASKNCYHILPFLIQNHIRLWVYSGDLDSHIPITGTKKWINQLKNQLQLPILKNWRQWWVPGKHKGQDQVGGMIWEIQGLTFVSVKGAGMRSGLDQPQAMSQILTGFITGKTLPYKQF